MHVNAANTEKAITSFFTVMPRNKFSGVYVMTAHDAESCFAAINPLSLHDNACTLVGDYIKAVLMCLSSPRTTGIISSRMVKSKRSE